MRCPSCERQNRPGARYCDNCGTLLAEASAPRHAPRRHAPPDALARKMRAHAALLEGERKHVTVLFADVSGSMDLAEQVDAEAWRAILDRFFGVLAEGVHRFEGMVVQFTGDGIMALFGAPVAHEDHALRAAHAALQLGHDLAEHAAELRREQGLNFSVRMGLNSGEVVVGALGEDLRVDFTAIGHTVGLAKRMEALAEPGRTYLTAATAELIDHYFELEDMGEFDVKGVREPVRVYALAGLGRARTRLDLSRARGFSRFVGRARELAVIEASLERALAGDGRVVAVVGEAGVGKSRLCHEFADRCRARGLSVYYATGAAHARSVPFHAALEMMRSYFGLDDGMHAQAARERVAGRMLLLDPRLADDLPLVLDFLGLTDPQSPAPRLDPDARMRRLLAAARTMTQAQAEREPTVSLFEDLHWVDPGSLMFLRAFVETVPGHSSLVLLNHRPEVELPWLAGAHYVELPLVPLGPEAVGELLEELLGRDPSLDGLPDELRRRTGGNPFFVEEIVRSLVEDGTLAGPRGAHRLARPLREVAVPPSVHGVLAARIDRLGERDKGVLQAAAVLGREFSASALERVAGLPFRALSASLQALVSAEFVLADGDGYAFTHALTQDVAYSTLLSERRRQTHRAVAEALAELHAERPDERAAEIAHHWDAAADKLEAMRWHHRAAVWAGTNDAVQAAAHWRAVRELADALPETAETLGLGIAARGWEMQAAWRLGFSRDEIGRLHEEGRERALRIGEPALADLFTVIWASISGLAFGVRETLPSAEAAMRALAGAGRPDLHVPALCFFVYALLVSGRYQEAREGCERGLELCVGDPIPGAGVVVADPHGWFHMMRGFLVGLMGDLDAGRAEEDLAIELCTTRGDHESAGWAHMNHALLAYFAGVSEGALEHAVRSLDIAERLGSAFSRIWARYSLGVAHIAAGSFDDAIAAFEDCVALVHRHQTGRDCEPWALTMLIHALIGRGDPERAVTVAQESLALADARGIRNCVCHALMGLGRALLARDDAGMAAQAHQHLEAALAVAREIGARAEEPLVLLALAESHRAAGDEDAAARSWAEARALFESAGARGHLAALAG